MSVLDRLEKVRKTEDLNKGQFEKALGKSSGYLKILKDKGGLPGADVFIKFSENFRNYDLNWLLTGDGSMLKNEEKSGMIAKEDPGDAYGLRDLQTVHRDLKGDLKTIHQSLIQGVETISDGVFHGLRDQQKILKFIEQLNPEEINGATRNLNKFLQEQKD